MSVLRNSVPVTRTRIAPIVAVLLAVLVNKDLLETERVVKVGKNIIP